LCPKLKQAMHRPACLIAPIEVRCHGWVLAVTAVLRTVRNFPFPFAPGTDVTWVRWPSGTDPSQAEPSSLNPQTGPISSSMG